MIKVYCKNFLQFLTKELTKTLYFKIKYCLLCFSSFKLQRIKKTKKDPEPKSPELEIPTCKFMFMMGKCEEDYPLFIQDLFSD